MGGGCAGAGSQVERCVPWPPGDAEVLQCRPYPHSWVPAVSSGYGVCWTHLPVVRLQGHMVHPASYCPGQADSGDEGAVAQGMAGPWSG